MRIKIRKDFVIDKHDILFFDTNIWLNLYIPTVEEDQNIIVKAKREKAAELLKDACEKGVKIYTSSLVISEFVNRYLRIMFAAEKSAHPLKYNGENAYKDIFRESEEYKVYLEEVLQIVETEILGVSGKTEDAFSSFNLSDYLGRENKEKLDFNDYCIEHICRRRNYKLVTSDGDFKKGNAQCEVLYI